MKPNKEKTTILSSNLFPVVGIGASAGGLDAFKKLLKAIPENSGMAYVLVQHLDPTHESMLPDLLQKVTNIPVLEISDELKVEPNHIYVIPSNKIMVANDGVLQLATRPEKSKNTRNLPIDLFFTSLAEVHQAHAIGIVLSGTASDGTAGLKAIKDHGGITFAQDEASAAYGSMPHSAILAGVVDFILSPEKIPQKLLEVTHIINGKDSDAENLPAHEDDVFKQIITLLRIRKGTDFTYYKQSTIQRRILRRMALNKNEEPAAYLTWLRENKTEQDVLYQDLLIPVTAFFRDQKSFDNLCKTVFPLIAKDKINTEPIRVWVAGCSTGQEAYSIAICFKEFLGNQQSVQIFATDISEPAIAKARSGVYTKTDVETVTAARLQEFFTKTNGDYQVNKTIRDQCVFAVHNFLKDPPFGKMDFISCRNALIYMEPYLQKKALTTFHYSLNSKRFLLLGKSETVSGVPDLFEPAAKNDKLFSRKDAPARFVHVASERSEQHLSNTDAGIKNETAGTDFQKTADDIMLSKYTPAGVVVNEAMDILHFRGSTGKYLEQSPGKPSHNLLKMAKYGLAFELRNILHKAKKEKTTVIKENIPLLIKNESQQNVSIEALPLPNTIEPYYLILFHDNYSLGNKQSPADNKKTAQGKEKTDDKKIRIQQLEKELELAREDMRSITEDQEAANEELQSANEELLSGSEELQSLNEELETNKEELQSTNEELTVVNHEIISLNEQVTEARDYAEAIVATIHEPLLVLDKNLRVKTANAMFYKTFLVSEQETEGQLIYELGNKQWNIPQLATLLEKVLPQKTTLKNFEVANNFPGIGERVMLLNARELKIEKAAEKLILLAIEDVTEQKLYQLKEKELLHRFQSLVMQAPVAIMILQGRNYTVELANDFYLQIVEQDKNFIGKPFFEALPDLKTQGMREVLDNVMQTGAPFYGNEQRFNMLRNNKREDCFFNFVYQPVLNFDKIVTGIIVVVNEVTEQVTARKRMEAQANMVQDLLMTAPGFICTLTGPDHVYGLVNERYQQLFGRRKIQGKPIMVALPELEGQGFDTLLDKVYTKGETYVGVDIPITLAPDVNTDPKLRYFNFSYQPMYDDSNKIFSILVFGYEVTEQVIAKNKILEITKQHEKELEEKVQLRTLELKEANELLLEKNEELLKMNKELESFTYISSHDLQEPLRKIQTFANRILEKEYATLSGKGKEYFQKMQEAGSRMQALIEDLLVYSHTNFTEREFEDTSLSKIVEEVIIDLEENITEKKAIIDYKQLDEAYINPFQFRQLIQNLIVNALKFSKAGTPPHITIKSRIAAGSHFKNENLLPDKNYCHISFTDNGIGFDPQYKEQIFEVFQRLHSREEYYGTGMGLAIVKKIVEKHNGIITAEGKPGQGATFNIYIPA